MVVMYSPRDPEMYSILHGTLHVCQYLGETGLKVIKVSQIDAVVGVPPLPFTQDEIDATQQDARVSQILSNRYFIAEKPELDTCYQTYDNENSSDCEDEEEE